MSWKRMKGIKSNTCDKCRAIFNDDEFDINEGLCLYCLFPEVTKSRPAEVSYEVGDPINKPKDSLDYLDKTVEVQSKAAIKKANDYKERKYVKKANSMIDKPKSTPKSKSKLPKSSKKTSKKRKVYKE